MARQTPPEAVVNIVFFALLFNLVTMAVGFAIVAGVASVRGQAGLVAVFAPAVGFLTLLATAVGFLRSALVSLLTDLVAPSEE